MNLTYFGEKITSFANFIFWGKTTIIFPEKNVSKHVLS